MSEPKTYAGGCHCGNVRFEVTTDLKKVISCNCSICSKRASLLTFVEPDAFTMLAGEGALTDYQFNKKVIHHRFCATCGIQSFASGTRPSDGKPMFAINARCLEGVDVDHLEITRVDGKHF